MSTSVFLHSNLTSSDKHPSISSDKGQSVRSAIRTALYRIVASLFIFLLSVLLAQAQHRDQITSARILLRQAMLDIDRRDYNDAITKLLEHRQMVGENANVCYLLGISYLYSHSRPLSMEKASFYLKKASNNINKDYEFWILDETGAPPEVLYHLGKAEEQLQNYANAASALEDYLAFLSADKDYSGGKMFRLIQKTALEFQLAAQNQLNSTGPFTDHLVRKTSDCVPSTTEY